MKTCSFFFALILFVQVSLQAQTVSQFRGNDRNGIFNESDLLTSWPETGPALLWTANDLGNGYGSPAITDDAIYITGEIDSTGYLFALDTQAGKLRWKTSIGKEWVKTFPGSRSTPAGGTLPPTAA